jgi:hypothetical protein
MSLFEQKYPNNIRTIIGLINIPFQDDSVLECDTTLSPVAIQLIGIPANAWSTQYKLYIVDKSNNASVNNIVISAPIGYKINGALSVTINANGGSYLIRVASNTNYVGQYSAGGGGITTLTVTDTSTIDLTLTPIAGGYNLQANLILADYLFAVKNLTDPNVLYCRTTKSIPLTLQKYENPFQSITDNSIFTAYDTKSEFGGLVGAFDLLTGTFTAPTTGLYSIQTQIGYALNINPYINTFDNGTVNSNGQYWMLNYVELYRVIDFLRDPATLLSPPAIGDRYIVGTPATGVFLGQENNIAEWNGVAWIFSPPISNNITQNFIFVITGSQSLTWNGTSWVAFIENLLSIGSFSIAQYLVGSGLLSVGIKTISMSSSQLYITTLAIFRLNAFSPVKVVYTNNTDLPMYGNVNSNVIFRVQKLSN